MLLDNFLTKGQNFLGCRYPIMCGAMTRISDHKLVGEVGNVVAFGLLADGNTPIDMLENEIKTVRDYTDNPFGIKLITVCT